MSRKDKKRQIDRSAREVYRDRQADRKKVDGKRYRRVEMKRYKSSFYLNVTKIWKYGIYVFLIL